jgi:hypothetical protein
MKRFIALVLCAATMASVAVAGDGKPCEPKKGKAPCKAGDKKAGKKPAAKPCDKKEAKGGDDWKAGALAGRQKCAEGGHKDCAGKAAGLCGDEKCKADGHKACRAAAPGECEAKAKELAGGCDAKKEAGKCEAKGDVPGGKKDGDKPCEKKEGGDCKPEPKPEEKN